MFPIKVYKIYDIYTYACLSYRITITYIHREDPVSRTYREAKQLIS